MTGPRRGAGQAGDGGPLAGPVVPPTPGTAPPVNGLSPVVPSGNSGAPQGTTAPAPATPRRLSTAAIERTRSRLSNRDQAILKSVNEHQFLTTGQIERLYFDSIAPAARGRVARRVLARLRDLRVLDTLDRRIGGARAGSHGFIYHVGVAGHRLLERAPHRTSRLRYDPSTRFVDHRLAVADAHIELHIANRAGQIELVDSAVEPASWRHFTGMGSTRRTLKPDLFAETATESGAVTAWLIEIDLGTEHLPTLLRKCREYEDYRQTGIEQDRHGGFPLVIWSMTHPNPDKADRRRRALREEISADRRLPSALFRIVAPEERLRLIQRGGAS